MAQVRTPHPNAKLTSLGRRAMVDVVVVEGWSVAATAERFGVDPKTVRKWRDRFVAEGPGGLVDRSSRPHRSPGRSSPEVRAEVIRLRRWRRRGAAWIAHKVALAPSTVQKILNEAGLGRLDRGDRATKPAPVRYQRERAGELVHVDIKKLPAIPPGGGWRVHGRGQAPTPGAKAGYRYLHTALDDRSRVAYSEILNDEQAITAAAFYQRAHAWFSARGVVVERVLTDNGPCYRSRRWTRDPRLPRRRRPLHPALPPSNQRQSRTLPPHPPRRMGLHPPLDQRRTTPRRLPRIPPLLQSPPSPRSAQLGRPRLNPQRQRPRNAQLGRRSCDRTSTGQDP